VEKKHPTFSPALSTSSHNWQILLDQINCPATLVAIDGSICSTNMLFDQSNWRNILKQIISQKTTTKKHLGIALQTGSETSLQFFQSIPIKTLIVPIQEQNLCLIKFPELVDRKAFPNKTALFHFAFKNKKMGECITKNKPAERFDTIQTNTLRSIAEGALPLLLSGNQQQSTAQTVLKNGSHLAIYTIETSIVGTGIVVVSVSAIDEKQLFPFHQLAISHSKSAIFIANNEGQILFGNPKLAEKTSDYSHLPNLKDLKCTPITAESNGDLWSSLKQNYRWDGKLGFSRNGGDISWGLFSVSEIEIGNRATLYLGIEHSEESLQAILSKLQKQYTFLDTILDSFAFPVTVYNSNNYAILHTNKAAENFKGILKCKQEGGRNKQYCNACIASAVNYCLLEEAYTQKKSVTQEVEVQAEENYNFFELTIYPIVTEGEISALAEIAIDVTDKKKLIISEQEEDIHKTEINKQKTLLASVINSIPDHIFYKDIEGYYFGANSAFFELVGQKSINGKKDFDLFPKELAYYYSLQDQLVLKKDIPAKSEKWVQFPNGKRALLDTLRVPFKFQGDTVGVIGISRDITNIKRIQKEILEQKEKIERHSEEIQSQRDFATKQNEEITQSINYALRIQHAVLPQKEDVDKLLHDYFIFFKPRDIVSGDFYWCAQKGDTTFIAAADCTGHGVPGALMSILGVAFLKQVIAQLDDFHTGSILNNLRKYIILSLHQTGRDGEARDGMDIALYSINQKTRKLQFSGAYNPLFVARNGILTEYKGDKMPISLHAIRSKFSTQNIQLQKGDAVYIFSDGYADQFGGKKNKKLKTLNFKKLIRKYSAKEMPKQKELFEHFFTTWKGQNEQVDDILLIGARF